MKNLLTETEVTKVGMNHERNHLRVYLSSTRLIHKKDIRQLESAIAQQIFKGRMMQVKVIEKYHLSEQYTPEKLLDLYRDSILEELKDYSLMEYNLLRTAKMEFTSESHMLLTLENTIIAQTRSHEIVEFLEKVICERCGLDLAVELAYEEPKESKYKKNSDLQIQFEIKNIMKKVHIRNDDGESVPAVAEGGAVFRWHNNIWWCRRQCHHKYRFFCKKYCKICRTCRKNCRKRRKREEGIQAQIRGRRP